MNQAEFERNLSKKQTKRRIMEGAIAVAFLAFFIVCCILRETTKEVIIHESPFFDWEEVNYNNVYMPLITFGIIAAIISGIFLLVDSILCGFRSVQKDGQYLTVCRGMLRNIVYIDGVEKGRMEPFTYSSVVEVWLASGTRATVSFGHTVWYIAHISFSDKTASIEV